MVRIAKNTDPAKLAELKKKIHESGYLDEAIQRIAQTLTKTILYYKEEK
ncbi:hypothetical protein [Spirochaeta cellobiosiphila]|nr:hypothetical protein [Spirochaeta cellobiosiphila]